MGSRHSPNEPDDFKSILIDLRDSPIENPDSKLMVKLFDWIMALPSTPDKHHWFCHRADETVIMASTFLIRLFAYESNKKLQWLERLEVVLVGCCDCVRGSQSAKWNARQTYLSVFQSQQLDEFMNVVNDWERSLIMKSLSKCGIELDAPQTYVSAQNVSASIFYHILSNIHILKSEHLSSVIKIRISSHPIEEWPPDPPPPGLFLLLFHHDITLRTYAASCFSRCQVSPMREEDFTSAYHAALDALSRFISAEGGTETGSSYSTEQSVIWESAYTALQHVPDQFLQSSSRTSIDLAHTIAGRLHDRGDYFTYVLKCFIYAIKRLKESFWANRGEDYSQVVFASIKDNPSFTELLQPTETKDGLPWFLLWLSDFAWSAWALHAFDDLLAKMFSFLCDELQHERFKETHPMIMWAASKLLVAVIQKSESPNELQAQAQRRAALSTLHIHIDRLVAVALSREYATRSEWSLARRMSRELIYLAMRSDIKDVLKSINELYEAFQANKRVRKGTLEVLISSPSIHQSIWTKVYDAINPGDFDAMAMIIQLLSRIAHLDTLMRSAFKPVFERVSPDVPAQQAFEEINRSLGTFRDGLSRVSSRFSNHNSTSSVQQLLKREGIVKGLWNLMFSPVEDVRVAGQTIVGQAFDVDIRSECFQSLIRFAPEQSFKGIFSILETFTTYVPSAPESCMLSASLVTCLTDIIDVLAGPFDSLLSDQSFVSGHDGFKPAAEIPTFWKLMARATAVIFQQTPAWSMFVDDNQWMVNWMRDALILCRQMLECWRKFEEAILTSTSAASHSTGKVSRVGRRMVKDLQVVLPELARWLRLTDQELLHQSFTLLQSLFSCFEAAQIPPDANALAKLKQDVERALNRSSATKLDSKRLRELRDLVMSFEQPDDEIEIISAPLLKQGKLALQTPAQRESIENRKSGGLKPSKRSQTSIKDFAHPGQPSGAATLGGKTIDSYFSPGDGRLASSSKNPKDSGKSARAMQARTFWKPLPAPSREPAKAAPTMPAQSFSARDQEKLDSAVAPRPKPIQPSKADAQALTTKSEPEDMSSSSSSDSEDGGIESLRTLQKKKQPERRTKIMNIVPGASSGHTRPTARDEARRARERMKPDVSDLHRAILSWPYEHEGDMPPGKPLSPRPVSDRYSTYWDFRTTFEPLLLLECWAQLVSEKREKKDIYDLEITSRQYTDQWIDVDAFIEEHFQSGWFLSEADVVLLRNPRTNQTILAKVQSFRAVRGHRQGAQTTLRCHLAGRVDPGLSPNTKWAISKAFSLATVHREYAALTALEFYDHCDFILNPRLSPPPGTDDVQVELTMKKHRVNGPQARAILSSLSSKGFSLIQGPPGTGKTSTICALVYSFLESRAATSTVIAAGRSSAPADKTAPKKVLICAPSNAAIDEVASRIRDGAGSRPVKIVRVGAEKALNLSTKDISLDAIVDERLNSVSTAAKTQNDDLSRLIESLASVRKALQEKEGEASVLTDNTARARALEGEREALQTRRQDLSRQINNLRDRQKSENRTLDSTRRNIRMQVLWEADVICSTLSGAGHDMLEHLDFEMIIVDEAAQAIELSTLIPLKFSFARCIMVGDPQQLPPTVISKEATKYNYNQSLFVRLQKQRPDAVHLLSIQYRMHPEISVLPSILFYHGRLQDGPDMAERTERIWQKNARFGTYRFFNVTSGREVQAGTSMTNPTEVSIAIKLYARLTKEYPSIDFRSRVGIVTPYRQQVNALRQAFRKQLGDDITSGIDFNTVDGFQGQEKDIIILSCVRAGPGLETIGFLSDERRMNVALTRAKSSLFILGHAPTLERSNQTWAQLIQDARRRSALIDIDGGFFTSAGPPKPHTTAQSAAPAPLPRPIQPALSSSSSIPALLTPSELRAKANHGSSNAAHAASLPQLPITQDAQSTTASSAQANKPENPKKRPAPAEVPAAGSSGSINTHPGPPSKKPKQTSMFMPKKKPLGR